MAIPESQLNTWSSQGSVTQSANTYGVIKEALESPRALYADKSFKVFLQGSYGNDTNIYAESDVDVVIQLDSIMRSGLDALPEKQRLAYHAVFDAADYTFENFKNAVITRLETAFGKANVKVENKAIKLKSTGDRRSADVVVCYQYREYTRFGGLADQEYTPGIIFPSVSNGEIINFPKLHSENLTEKHQATNAWFKPTVRIFKNIRSKLVEKGLIAKGDAPSYFVEGLLFNVPNSQFGTSYTTTFCNCVNWLHKADKQKLVCANQQYWLLGNGNVQWQYEKCDLFLKGIIRLWNEW